MALTPPSSSSSPMWSYDVFLSFRGEDTREGFTSHLYHALSRAGVYTFMDVRLSRGEEISAQLSRKIEQSRFSIVVFSANYASSGWCLDELVKIMECEKMKKHQVIPVFYKVEPSEIRHQRGKTGEYLSQFSEKFGENSVKLKRWKSALRDLANSSGWSFTQGNIEQDLIQAIVVEVSRKLDRTTSLSVAYYPVGLDDHVERINPLLGVAIGAEVRMIGIYGDEGIGKSTIAKAVFNLYGPSFEGSSFLANVKATSGLADGIAKVQETLLLETLGDDSIRLRNPHKGVNLIAQRLRFKRVLVVIDDVDELDHLRQLAGEKEWFGPGSRIVITTQHEDLLRSHGVEHLYEAEGLNWSYSSQLFCWNAFRRLDPPEMFVELSQRVLKFIAGIPQALIMIGSYLHGKSEEEWEIAVCLLEEACEGGRWDQILEITIDGLKQLHRAIFLIVACFLNGRSRETVMRICRVSESVFDFGIEELIGKSLISIQKNRVYVSDSLRGPAKNILRTKSRMKARVMDILEELDEATDELGDKIESTVRSIFEEIFEDSDDDDEEDVVDELADGIKSLLEEGGEAIVDIADGIGLGFKSVLDEGEDAVAEIADGIESGLKSMFSFFS